MAPCRFARIPARAPNNGTTVAEGSISLRKSLRLLASSAAVLAADQALAVFPLESGRVALLVVAAFVGPLDALHRSGALLGATWGERLLDNVGIGQASRLLASTAIAFIVPPAVLSVAAVPAALTVAIALAVVAVLAIAVVGTALRGIFTAALYRYAADGTVGGDFEPALIQQAFIPGPLGAFGLRGRRRIRVRRVLTLRADGEATTG